ncbi:hypothetical protein BDW67DRAFT_167593 [Aspergillus spinulosporus]
MQKLNSSLSWRADADVVMRGLIYTTNIYQENSADQLAEGIAAPADAAVLQVVFSKRLPAFVTAKFDLAFYPI